MSSFPVIDFDDDDPDAADQVSFETPSINPADIRFAAMNFLARREHTRHELCLKLQRRFPDSGLIEFEVQRLCDENLQSDERFAENFVNYRAGLGFGLMHIRQDMRQRGLSDKQIVQAVEAAEIDWAGLAEKVYRKKFGELPAEDIKGRARRGRYMQYRGFANDEYQHLF